MEDTGKRTNIVNMAEVDAFFQIRKVIAQHFDRSEIKKISLREATLEDLCFLVREQEGHRFMWLGRGEPRTRRPRILFFSQDWRLLGKVGEVEEQKKKFPFGFKIISSRFFDETVAEAITRVDRQNKHGKFTPTHVHIIAAQLDEKGKDGRFSDLIISVPPKNVLLRQLVEEGRYKAQGQVRQKFEQFGI